MLDRVIDAQAALIAALDAQDADVILSASAALSAAVEELRRAAPTADQDRIDYGLKQTDAARIRVKYLTAWNRQEIDRLAELRGQVPPATYAKPRLLAL
jgi:hypothetical protein